MSRTSKYHHYRYLVPKLYTNAVRLALVRGAVEGMFFFLKIKTRKGYIQAIYDSGSMSCVANEDILVNHHRFLNERCKSLGYMQVVGGDTQTQNSYKVLIPIVYSQYSYQSTPCISVGRIVDYIPIQNLACIMVEAYEAYGKQCDIRGEVPVARELWPLSGEYGGKVEFLLGVGTMEFSILFQYCGLTFISHNIDSNSPISFGGHYRSSKDENPSPSAALMQRVTLENCPDGKNPQL